ncbi:HNH endonuclease signature motif containing protein [Protaetiibacter intestinalis]|uniref:HNH endonuclease n=1 Tax=Protaetiibacter intestinalis TaxID=2419774 RepID=A0A387BHE8_9MICO|nr:HNH endonuclease signature motif containing protein [Protaetiibacter intestinalis]AYF97960.1 HNH endonuclease [Protaetiibacter intestinalis]
MAPFQLVNTLREQLATLRGVPASVAAYRESMDGELLEASRLIGELQRVVDGHRALVAGEIARRSVPAFGYDGFAQRAGHRTAEEFLRAHTGATMREVKTAVRAGQALHEAVELPDARTGEIVPPSAPWMRAVVEAVGAGVFGAEHVASIRRGLGDPGEGVTAELLAEAARTICAEAVDAGGAPGEAVPDADRVFRRARELRDELDEAGIADRERQRIAQRSLRVIPQPDGMTRLTWLLDPESAGYVTDLYNRITSPKRGGPRFVDPTQRAAAEQIELDPRTPEQLASDVFLDLLRAGSVADATQLLGAGGAAVQLVVTREQLETPTGHGWITGQSDPVSRPTVERHLCADGYQQITVDPAGNPLDVGRTRRLHTAKQRTALAIRDGGCRFGDCDRTVGMVEAHHIDHWGRDRGGTSVERGILLCRYHHLRIHNEGWRIDKHGDGFVLIPPPGVDPRQTPIPMRSKSPVQRDLARRRVG